MVITKISFEPSTPQVTIHYKIKEINILTNGNNRKIFHKSWN